jgi:uncharacterized protein YjbI with pentapeptide repeats
VADEEHLRQLKQGAEVWNTWRRDRLSPPNYPDLSHADLSGAADLFAANLRGANLSDAHLNADLTGADLTGANLSGADLSGAILHHADLRLADLTRASLLETVFADVNLTGVIGLETCEHLGPSAIDHRTLQKSGPLPLPFLRGVGLPDNLIAVSSPKCNKSA